MEKEEVKVPKGQNEKKMSSFITRLVSGIVLLLIMLVIVPAGGMPMFIMTYLISMCGLFELYRVFGIEKIARPCRLYHSDRVLSFGADRA